MSDNTFMLGMAMLLTLVLMSFAGCTAYTSDQRYHVQFHHHQEGKVCAFDSLKASGQEVR